MPILDLQGMQLPKDQVHKQGSHGSKGCGTDNRSFASLACNVNVGG